MHIILYLKIIHISIFILAERRIMKYHLKTALISAIILAASSLTTGAGNADTAKDNEDAVCSVQIGTIKTPADQLGRARIEKLTELLDDVMQGEPLTDIVLPEDEPPGEPRLDEIVSEELQPESLSEEPQPDNDFSEELPPDASVQAEALSDMKSHIILHIRYDSGRKDTYRFFNENTQWLMQSPDGTVYGNADFISDYVQISTVDTDEAGTTTLTIPSDKLLKLSKELGTHDWNSVFTVNVYHRILYGSSLDEAVQNERKDLRQKLLLARYAQKNGFAPDESELEDYLTQLTDLVESAENYEEAEAAFESAGLTLKDEIRHSAKSVRTDLAREALYQVAYNNFWDGNDTIDGTEYWDVYEYWNAYVEKIINPTMDQSDLDEIDACLNTAEEFCREHLPEN